MPRIRDLPGARLARTAVACVIGLASVGVAGAAGAHAAEAQAAGAHAGEDPLSWRQCVTTAKDWPEPDDTRSECALLTVPMDYAKPQGRKIKIAVSRLKATDPGRRRGVLVISPGGPGLSNISAPASYAASGLATLAVDHDLIGLDPRGVGYSDKIMCAREEAKDDGEKPPSPVSRKEQAKDLFDHEAAYNKRCAAKDPAFVQQLTTANIARDVDAIRAALGESKINFYGVSYGTAVGVNYRSMFDARVDRMWVDSTMPPTMDLAAMDGARDALAEKNFGRFTSWLARHDAEYHFGTTDAEVRTTLFALRDRLTRKPREVDENTVLDGEWVRSLLGGWPSDWISYAKDLATVREGGVPLSARPAPQPSGTFGFDDTPLGLNGLQYQAIFCNDGVGGRDFEQVWANAEARRSTFPATGGYIEASGWCGSWPWPARPWKPVKGTSPLQVSGHVDENVTPYAWAVDTWKAAGGTLLTVQDNQHGSLRGLPCATKVVDFFRTGRTTGGTCPGVR
ncbi:alpha/beta fold hydrolase [Spongiactinospora sp. TRM90649]|uniref:alpha/beta fold hydrolase n=1 Tax=Spongiactinospora sp. TRM90649 TaxID=3031114 RepID=UPI0023F7F648|nr:alpha/beta fold hydrolase [Spongiactinospora sp. TRM90649]MDF5751245.1 alpha/beta fold hydrolase [Spongiactinospora sp. TRM90649]